MKFLKAWKRRVSKFHGQKHSVTAPHHCSGAEATIEQVQEHIEHVEQMETLKKLKHFKQLEPLWKMGTVDNLENW